MNVKRNNILITGLGTVSAAGNTLSETLVSFRERQRNAGNVTLFSTSMKYPVFEVSGMEEKYMLEGQRTLGLTLCAVDEAFRQARLGDDLSGLRVGICLGTTVASQLNDIEFYRSYREHFSAPMTSVDRYLSGNIAEYVSRAFQACGPVMTVVNACSSGTDAIGVAMSWLKGGLCDIAVAGGADELNLVPYCGFGSLGVVSKDPCRPYDRDRKGLNLGEGAGILVIETEASAEKRGAAGELFLAGYGSAADAYHLTSPRPDGAGLVEAINRALRSSGIGPDDIGFVNAHGTATRDNDLVEGGVLGRIFGADLTMLSTKGFTGHTLGAAGGLEAAFSAAALMEGWIPASAGFKSSDEEIPVSPVTAVTDIDCRYALSTSLAFGGNNSALIIGKGVPA